jgi:hypothetical protein
MQAQFESSVDRDLTIYLNINKTTACSTRFEKSSIPNSIKLLDFHLHLSLLELELLQRCMLFTQMGSPLSFVQQYVDVKDLSSVLWYVAAAHAGYAMMQSSSCNIEESNNRPTQRATRRKTYELLHAYKTRTRGQPRVAQQCILPHRGPSPRACFMSNKERVKKKNLNSIWPNICRVWCPPWIALAVGSLYLGF